ncbi:outer membrane beta-barrel protein [Undibacterium crateris]|uniref:outer membrane beta-barrel protein n=1 Tax=Undibacterium crateris TaxID=2528175 RepID=UPI0013897168|nr:outer membrane beta-barrel protein [Undibacterium crateris]NDI85931.1 outer membrane beta-barrel protein [Undibacterium crateris]
MRFSRQSALTCLLSLCLTLLSATASAQTYLGVSGGKMSTNLSCKNSCQTSASNLRLYAGADLNSNWSIESQLHTSGELKGTFSSAGQYANATVTTKAIDLTAMYRWRMNDRFALFSRAGLTYTISDVKNTSTSSSSRYKSLKPIVGAGLAYAITPLTYLRGELDIKQARVDGRNTTITGFGIGIQSAF